MASFNDASAWFVFWEVHASPGTGREISRISATSDMMKCAGVCACVCACMRACERLCVSVRVCVRARVCLCVLNGSRYQLHEQ